MIVYRDMTFCNSVYCLGNCGRKLTEKDRREATKIGLPIAASPFCGPDGYPPWMEKPEPVQYVQEEGDDA